jgi:hypothetical protein
MEFSLSESLFKSMREMGARSGTPVINLNGKRPSLPAPEHFRAMMRVRARTESESDIYILHRFRALAKATAHFTDPDLRRQAKALLDNFANIANAFGEACLVARELESKCHTNQRQKALLNPVMASIQTMSEELVSLQARQGGLPAEKRLEVLGRFTEARYGNGPLVIQS